MDHKQQITEYLRYFKKIYGHQLLEVCAPGELPLWIAALRALEKDGTITLVTTDNSAYIKLHDELVAAQADASDARVVKAVQSLAERGVNKRQIHLKLGVSKRKVTEILGGKKPVKVSTARKSVAAPEIVKESVMTPEDYADLIISAFRAQHGKGNLFRVLDVTGGDSNEAVRLRLTAMRLAGEIKAEYVNGVWMFTA